LREGGVRPRERRQAADRLSAVILLESYLQWCALNQQEHSGAG